MPLINRQDAAEAINENLENEFQGWVGNLEANIFAPGKPLGWIILPLMTLPKRGRSFFLNLLAKRINRLRVGTPAARQLLSTFLVALGPGIDTIMDRHGITEADVRAYLSSEAARQFPGLAQMAGIPYNEPAPEPPPADAEAVTPPPETTSRPVPPQRPQERKNLFGAIAEIPNEDVREAIVTLWSIWNEDIVELGDIKEEFLEELPRIVGQNKEKIGNLIAKTPEAKTALRRYWQARRYRILDPNKQNGDTFIEISEPAARRDEIAETHAKQAAHDLVRENALFRKAIEIDLNINRPKADSKPQGVPMASPAAPSAPSAPPAPKAAPASAAASAASTPKKRRNIAGILADMTDADKRDMLGATWGIVDEEITRDIDETIEGDAAKLREAIIDALEDNKDKLGNLLATRAEAKDAVIHYRRAQRYENNDGTPIPIGPKRDEIAEQLANDAAKRIIRENALFLECMLMDYVGNHTDPDVVNKGYDLFDRLTRFAGMKPSTKFASMKERVNAIGRAIANAFAISYALAVVWSTAIIYLGFRNPDIVFTVTNYGAFALVLFSVSIMFIGSRSPVARLARQIAVVTSAGLVGMLALALGYFTATFASTSDLITSPIGHLKPFHLPAYVLTIFALILWYFVAIGGAQKIIQGMGEVPKFIERVIGKGSATATAEALKKNAFLTNIGTTVLAAVVVMWILLGLLWGIGFEQGARNMVVFYATLLALGVSLTGQIVRAKYPKTTDTFQDFALKDAKGLYFLRNWLPPLLVVALLLVAFGAMERASVVGAKITNAVDHAIGYTDQDTVGGNRVRVNNAIIETQTPEEAVRKLEDINPGHCAQFPQDCDF